MNYLFKLYVTGQSANSIQAIENLQSICKERFKKDGPNGRDQYEIKVIDVLKHPEEADEAKILASPTLVKELPPPASIFIGNLSNKEKLLADLGCFPNESNA